MPPDTTKSGKSYIEARRARGEIACAECRRLKLRCDKQVPCGSCVRRGCSLVCPNGVLSSGHGSRFVLADTEQLYRKLISMSERIRQLEDALQVTTASNNEKHPLLSEELLAIKHGIDGLRMESLSMSNGGAEPSAPAPRESEEPEDPAASLHESFGTLTVSADGSTRFIGSTGGSEILLMNEGTFQGDSQDVALDPVSFLVDSWPFATLPHSVNKSHLLGHLLDNLPTKARLSSLCEAFLENVTWFYRIITRPQIMEELIPSVYKKLENPADRHTVDPHDLALLLIICALGAVGDLTEDPNNDEGFGYFNAARAALSLKSIFDSATINTIQALFIMSSYIVFSGRLRSLESAWLTLNLAKSLAISTGLHRDPSRWNLGPLVEQRRREVFWELFLIDNWQALAVGRPNFFPLYAVDVKFPEDMEAYTDRDGTSYPSYLHWSYKFARDLVYKITLRMASSEPLKVSDVLELDRAVREYPLYPLASKPLDAQAVADEGAKAVMQRFMPTATREFLLLYIHRNFFAKSIRNPKLDPIQTPYSASFLSAYRSSIMILKLVRKCFSLLPAVCARCWFVWHHSLCAVIVIGSVIALRPHSDLAPVALAELGLAVEMYEKATAYSKSLGRLLPVVHRLRSKAYKAYIKHRDLPVDENNLASMAGYSIPGTSGGAAEFSEELAALGGEARTLPVRSKQPQTPSVASSSAVPPGSQSPQSVRSAPFHYARSDTSGATGTIPHSVSQTSPSPSPSISSSVLGGYAGMAMNPTPTATANFDQLFGSGVGPNFQGPQSPVYTTQTNGAYPYAAMDPTAELLGPDSYLSGFPPEVQQYLTGGVPGPAPPPVAGPVPGPPSEAGSAPNRGSPSGLGHEAWEAFMSETGVFPDQQSNMDFSWSNATFM